MKMNAEWRDIFPKSDLGEGYLGDRYPLCTSLPRQAFLRRGARYRYTGLDATEKPKCEKQTGCKRMTLDGDASALYVKLCGASGVGAPCSFPAEVRLDAHIPCHGDECLADTLSVVKVKGPLGQTPVYYEYVPTPCVFWAFPEGGLKVLKDKDHKLVCGDPKSFAGIPGCCNPGEPTGKIFYWNHTYSFEKALQRHRSESP